MPPHAYPDTAPLPAQRLVIAEIGGLEALRKEAHRTFVGQLAQRITEAFDRMAGPLGLTPDERELQQVCRDRFQLYDPTCERQIRFVLELGQLTATSHCEPDLSEDVAPAPRELAGEDTAGEHLGQRQLEEHRSIHRPHPVVERPGPRQLQPSRRSEWARYLSRWRGGGDGDEGDPGRRYAGGGRVDPAPPRPVRRLIGIPSSPPFR